MILFGLEAYGNESLGETIEKMHRKIGDIKNSYENLSEEERALKEREFEEMKEKYERLINSESQKLEELITK